MALSDWLFALTDAELDRLAEAFGAGRLMAETSATLLRSYGLPEGWAEPLAAAKARYGSLDALGEMVSLARQERSRTRSRAVELVCTRPHGGLVDILDTSVAVRRLFRQARQEVLVAGFRIHDREMLEPLRRSAAHPLNVRLFVDIDPALSASGARQQVPSNLDGWPAIWWSQFLEGVWPLYLDPPRAWYAPSTLGPSATGEWRSMHVKSVVVDRRYWFVTSANFTSRGHTRNIELGALIDDPDRASEVVAAFEQWVGAGVFRRIQ